MAKALMDLEWKLFQYSLWLDTKGLLNRGGRNNTDLVKEFLEEVSTNAQLRGADPNP